MIIKKFIFPFTPQTNVRSTQKATVLFQIPEECPHRCGLPRRSSKAELITVEQYNKKGEKVTKQVRYGCPHMLSVEGLQRKRGLEKYNKYKIKVNAYARSQHFVLPFQGAAIYFFLPMPVRWNKTQREIFHLTDHQSKPDLNNLVKAFEDALFPDRGKDEMISHYAGQGKYWVDTYNGRKMKPGSGWIEVHLNLPQYNPKTGSYGRWLILENQFIPQPERITAATPAEVPLNEPKSYVLPFEGLESPENASEKIGWQFSDDLPVDEGWYAKQEEKARDHFRQLPDKVDASDKEGLQRIIEAHNNRKKKKR